MTPAAGPSRAPLAIETHGSTIVLSLGGELDEQAGAALVEAAEAALEREPERIDIDLRDLARWTNEGVRALVRCREVCSPLLGGLHYRTGRGPGRDALLAAYT
jgi:ABC-type transporter Mla MlaB component